MTDDTRSAEEIAREELERESGEPLPSREAMSLIGGTMGPGVYDVPPGAEPDPATTDPPTSDPPAYLGPPATAERDPYDAG